LLDFRFEFLDPFLVATRPSPKEVEYDGGDREGQYGEEPQNQEDDEQFDNTGNSHLEETEHIFSYSGR
jgi:hypothetical protein